MQIDKLTCPCGLDGPKETWTRIWNNMLKEFNLYCPKCGRLLGILNGTEVELLPNPATQKE
jgi:hypothetical protein